MPGKRINFQVRHLWITVAVLMLFEANLNNKFALSSSKVEFLIIFWVRAGGYTLCRHIILYSPHIVQFHYCILMTDESIQSEL